MVVSIGIVAVVVKGVVVEVDEGGGEEICCCSLAGCEGFDSLET